MSDAWAAVVAATRKQRKPLYWVETIMGTTVDVCASLIAARKYIAEAKRPHLYRIYKQGALGRLTEVR